MLNKKNIILVISSIVLGLFSFYLYKQTYGAPDNFVEEANNLVEVVGKLIVLPEGELPTIATVTDPELLKDQPFFAKAKEGDKVLVYVGAGKMYLYSLDEKRVLEVAPVDLGVTNSSSR